MPDPFGSGPLELDELGNEGGGPAEPAVSGAGLPAEPPEGGDAAYGMGEPGGSSQGSPAGEEGEDDFEEFSVDDLTPDELAELGLGETPADEEGMTLEDLEQYVEADPAGAIQYLAALQAEPAIEELHRATQERLAPVMAKHHTDVASWTLDTLRAQFSPAVVESYKEQLAEYIQAHPQALLGQPPETQVALLGDKLRALEYERQQAYNRGDDIIGEIDSLSAPQQGDPFGIGSHYAPEPAFVDESAVPQPPSEPPADPRGTPPRDPRTGRFLRLEDGSYAQVVERPGPVHVEGGSQGQPMGRQVDPNPTIAAIDALENDGSDFFGRPVGFGRR